MYFIICIAKLDYYFSAHICTTSELEAELALLKMYVNADSLSEQTETLLAMSEHEKKQIIEQACGRRGVESPFGEGAVLYIRKFYEGAYWEMPQLRSI